MTDQTNYLRTNLTDFDSFIYKLNRIHSEENFKQANQSKYNSLTKRELQVLNLLANDMNNPQIAKKLFISRYTVEQHRKNINRKLGISSHTQLFKFALAFNLI
ncbi:MAG: helix-turn-helix transcriptional regulator [Cytophagales bacterium]|nr:helix-turn-helix transcriptional regulator [Cytophagales bacterium]